MYIWMMDGVMKEVGMERRGEWRLLGLLYADALVLCGESEDDGGTVC